MNENLFTDRFVRNRKSLAVLIDPDEASESNLEQTIQMCNEWKVNYIFVGGSLLVKNNLDEIVYFIKERTSIPVILFPGNGVHVTNKADGILLLSLISGRNPEYLIGQHVLAAPRLKASGLEIIPTGYLLIEGGSKSAVAYVSDTSPIPRDQIDIAVCTAMAGEMKGNAVLYLDAGSGATTSISVDMIAGVKNQTSLPLIVGGGIRSGAAAAELCVAGADIVVVGNAIEKRPNLIEDISTELNKLNHENHSIFQSR